LDSCIINRLTCSQVTVGKTIDFPTLIGVQDPSFQLNTRQHLTFVSVILIHA
jgi:hypothetical protein